MFIGFEDDEIINRTSRRLAHLTTKVDTYNMESLLDDDENEKLKQRRALG